MDYRFILNINDLGNPPSLYRYIRQIYVLNIVNIKPLTQGHHDLRVAHAALPRQLLDAVQCCLYFKIL